MAATVRDIAREVGVSAATVSRALSRPDSVAPETRSRVLRAAEQLGYSVPATRGSIVSSRTGSLGMVVPDLDNPTFSSILKSAQQRAHLRGYEIYIADCAKDPATEAEMVKSLAARSDGLIICSPRNEPSVLQEFAELTRLVLVDGSAAGVPAIAVDYVGGMRETVDHLVALGHTQLAYAGARTPTWSEGQRRAGLAEAIAHYNLPEFVDLGRFGAGIAGGYAAADRLLASQATAVVCINDFLALGLMNRLQRRGIGVPEDISIVEFDNANTAQLVSPLLTSVVPPANAVGWSAADTLIQVIDGSAQHAESRVIPVELTIRESTAQVRLRAPSD